MPLQYNVEHEVMMDKFIAPTRRQEGQPFSIDVYINNKNDSNVAGDVSVTDNGKLIPLGGGQTTQRVTLKPGPNVERIQLPAQRSASTSFTPRFPISPDVTAEVGDDQTPVASQLDNKSADAFTFVQGKGRVLLVDNTDPMPHRRFGEVSCGRRWPMKRSTWLRLRRINSRIIPSSYRPMTP